MPEVQPVQGAAAPPPGGGGPASGSPAAAPLSTPNNKEGEKKAAALYVSHMIVPMLEKSLVAMGSSSEEGQSILKALNALTKHFPNTGENDELGQSAIMQLMGNKQR